jgi:hypothetical protein
VGSEATCLLTYAGETAEVKALLETDELVTRGQIRLRIPLAGLKAEAVDGRLSLAWGDETATLELGAPAARWADRITNPKTLVDKLGVKPGQRVTLAGVELELRGVELVDSGADHVFLQADSVADLDRIGPLAAQMARDGGVWVVAPKGGVEPRESQVLEAGRAAGLKDVKVTRWSDTHTAHRFVIPLADR